jgi:MYXO-CTERM domain-containing protein
VPEHETLELRGDDHVACEAVALGRDEVAGVVKLEAVECGQQTRPAVERGRPGFFAHTSICTVADDIAATYPAQCDGSAACACVGGVSQCMPECSAAMSRVGKFGVQYGGEIIISSTTPQISFYSWLFEDAKGDANCGFTLMNAHRFLLLTGGDAVGFGASNGFTVGDFGSPGVAHKIPSGTHWPREGTSVEVWANWYDFAGAPQKARVNVDGICTDMQLARGTPDNAAYTVMLDGLAPGCHRYYFQFVDGAAQPVTYPTAGSLAIGPADACPDFSDERPKDCDCISNCDGAQCGDDGCGGSCGECIAPDVCSDGQCVFQGCDPACPVGACGSDGCGGQCGCPAPQTCEAGLCVGADEDTDTPTSGAGETASSDAGSTSDPATSSPTAPTSPTSPTQATGDDETGDDGCSCRTTRTSSATWLLALVGLASARRRRR